MANDFSALKFRTKFKHTIGLKVEDLLKYFQCENTFCDVVIACEGKQLLAHKIVISSSSPLLRNILKDNNDPNPFIYLRGVDASMLENLLHYMYFGEVIITKENINKFLSIAKDLEIIGLCKENEHKNLFIKPFKRLNETPEMGTEQTIQKVCPQIGECEETNISLLKEKHTNILQNMEMNIDPFQHKDKVTNTLFPKENKPLDLPFSCEKCTKKFAVEISLLTHNELIHNEIIHKQTDFHCDKCDHKTKTMEGIEHHIRVVHEGIRYPCDRCDYKSTTPTYLRQHKQLIHEGIKPYIRASCDQCDFKSRRGKSDLKAHVNAVHIGIRLQCEKCEYSTPRRRHLVEHNKRRHSNSGHENVYYQCKYPQCDKRVLRKDRLKRHIAAVHKGIRHLCDQCNFTTTRTDNLQTHIKKKHIMHETTN